MGEGLGAECESEKRTEQTVFHESASVVADGQSLAKEQLEFKTQIMGLCENLESAIFMDNGEIMPLSFSLLPIYLRCYE